MNNHRIKKLLRTPQPASRSLSPNALCCDWVQSHAKVHTKSTFYCTKYFSTAPISYLELHIILSKTAE